MPQSWWKYWRKIGHIPKKRVESLLSIDSSKLYDARTSVAEGGERHLYHGCLIELYPESIFATQPGGDPSSTYTILVKTTKCNYGGVRHWFLCTNPKCRRRSKSSI